MSVKYREYQQLNLPSIEQEILELWATGDAFQKSVDTREGAAPFVFYEGPPSANGMPGIHHVIARSLKDLVCRYKTMRGFQVKRKAGWDTHGLPVELGVEKMLGITKEDIGKNISIAEYNAICRKEVLKYKDQWDELTLKMGYWVDLEHPYITFENNYIESLWWILKELYKKEFLYESVSIQPYSPAAGTGLSSHELNQPGTYKDVKDTSCVAMFKAKEDDRSRFLFKAAGNDQVFFLAWTTTPWTLPSNLGLTVGGNIDYVLVRTFNPYTHLPIHVVLAKSLLSKYFKTEAENVGFEDYHEGVKVLPWSVLAECSGKDLEGIRYEQLMPYEANTTKESGGDPFRVMLGDFVTTEDGTGIVHTAPAFGADDYRVGKKYNIGILVMVDRQGKFVEGLGEFSGRYVKDYKDEPGYVDVNVDICVKLKKENRAFKVEKYEHSYPHCWRTDKPILYYPLDAWFIRTTALKDQMVALNKTINWKPKSTGEGRFGNWLENMVDWNLSRSRYWGTPLPVWRTVLAEGEEEKGREEICIGSIRELTQAYQRALDAGYNKDLGLVITDGKLDVDLHKPIVDSIVLLSSDGKPMKRVSDLVDVWFDSGAMPYAQWHFPFENKEIFAQNYPADFIAEGVDQTRGWFYTLHAIGSLIKESVHEELLKDGLGYSNLEDAVADDKSAKLGLGRPILDGRYPGLAYKTVVSNGLVLDKAGNKMSKSKGNVVNPFETIEKFGADATRWYLITNASPWESIKFDLEGIKEVQRKFFGTLYNTYQFFALYANVDGFSFREDPLPVSERPEIDRWIISALHTLISDVQGYMDDYEPTQAGRAIEDFVDSQLSNWYVRLCRRRFWKGEYEQDKICAYQTLYECMETVLLLMAPIAPFFSDAIYRNLNAVTNRSSVESVHHADFPQANKGFRDQALEQRMQMAQDISSLVLSLRKKVNIKVRQPLQKILIPILNPDMREQIEKVADLIKSEVNVKEIQFLTDTEGFIKKKIKPNFKALGNRLGAKMKSAAVAIGAFSQEDISRLEKEKKLLITLENDSLELQLEDVEISSEDIPGWTVAVKGNLTVALDIIVSPELAHEGNAREFVNRIQKIRKDSGFELMDRVDVKVAAAGPLVPSIQHYSDYICTEILADSLEIMPNIQDGIEIEVNDISLKVIVTKKGA